MEVRAGLKSISAVAAKQIARREVPVTKLARKPSSPSESTIRRIQRGKGYDPKLSTLIRLSNGLGIGLDQLVKDITTKSTTSVKAAKNVVVKTSASAQPFPVL